VTTISRNTFLVFASQAGREVAQPISMPISRKRPAIPRLTRPPRAMSSSVVPARVPTVSATGAPVNRDLDQSQLQGFNGNGAGVGDPIFSCSFMWLMVSADIAPLSPNNPSHIRRSTSPATTTRLTAATTVRCVSVVIRIPPPVHRFWACGLW
jgi:hypothetical protein